MASPNNKPIVGEKLDPEKLLFTQEAKRRKLVHYYMGEEKVAVQLSPFYAPYLGKNAMISVQGVSVYIPANNQVYKIPKTHAAQLYDAVAAIDLRQQKLAKMSNIRENFEPSMGALRF